MPQGSILGPLLFIIYINDIYKISDLLKVYADDTNAFVTASTSEELNRKGNEVLSFLIRWTSANRLTINTENLALQSFHPIV